MFIYSKGWLKSYGKGTTGLGFWYEGATKNLGITLLIWFININFGEKK